MSSPPFLDVEALLEPIPGDNPAGKDVRYDGTHDAIKDARREDDVLSQGEWLREIKTADWPAVTEIAMEVLATKSKDLQVAGWLAEALLKRYGFPGLRDGLQLMRELQERFWDAFYPEIEEGDLEPRAAPLIWLNEKLPLAIRQVPITHGMSGEHYSWLHWRESRDLDNLGKQDHEAMLAALAEGKITGEQFDKTVDGTSLAQTRTLFEDLNQLFQEYEQLDRAVDEKFGRVAPSLRDLKEAIEDCHILVTDILKKKGGMEPEAAPPEPKPKAERGLIGRLLRGMEEQPPLQRQSTSEISGGDAPSRVISLMPQDRADALCRLSAVAEFFRRTEPHSPVAYLVQRAVRWGEMPLEEWLREVIHDDSVLGQLRETLGLKDAEGDTSGM